MNRGRCEMRQRGEPIFGEAIHRGWQTCCKIGVGPTRICMTNTFPSKGTEMQPEPRDARTFYADAFKDWRVVDAYRPRPPYPDEVFAILASLLTDEPRSVLDVGAGSGDLARRMVEFAGRVDAVDFSASMIEQSRRLPHRIIRIYDGSTGRSKRHHFPLPS